MGNGNGNLSLKVGMSPFFNTLHWQRSCFRQNLYLEPSRTSVFSINGLASVAMYRSLHYGSGVPAESTFYTNLYKRFSLHAACLSAEYIVLPKFHGPALYNRSSVRWGRPISTVSEVRATIPHPTLSYQLRGDLAHPAIIICCILLSSTKTSSSTFFEFTTSCRR